MQAASDTFLGWTSYLGDYYQVGISCEMKGSVNLDVMTPNGFASYAEVRGHALARAHARSGGAAVVAGHLGRAIGSTRHLRRLPTPLPSRPSAITAHWSRRSGRAASRPRQERELALNAEARAHRVPVPRNERRVTCESPV
jgi:uncharacterized protein DUF2252